MNIALWVLALSATTPRLPYGDVAVAEHADPVLALEPAEATSVAELTLAEAAFEGLYRLDDRGEVWPELARELPRWDGLRAVIPLSPVARHDGKPLDANSVVEAMLRWQAPGSLARHLLLPLAGARTGKPELGTTTLDDGTVALVVRLAQPFPELARLWASSRARLSMGGRVPVGTGPFRIESVRAEGVSLVASAAHREGRPYLDRLLFRAASGARPPPATGATLVLDVYGPSPPPGSARELWVLRVGARRPELRSALLFRAIEGALGRERLAKRYLSGDASPTATLRGADDDPQLTLPPKSGGARATLAMPARLARDRRFAERIQLDLLQAGVTATLETVDDRTLARARRSADVELALDGLLFEGSPHTDATQALFVLMATASATGCEHVLSEPELAAFAAEDEPARLRRVAALDRRLRDEAWLVPIAERAPRARPGSGLIDTRVTPSGAVALDDAWSARLLPVREEDR
jgi:MarR-like DNA-binding transcriptional regulator SgrR of sgrS sRNA